MKVIFSIALMLAAVAVLSFSVPAQASGQDDQIESSAKQSYVFKNYLKDDEIKIKSKDGVVSLTGTVSEESHKLLAAETVASLPGVKSVDNKLEVKEEKHDEMSDAWIMTKVKTTLLFHRNVSGFKTEVDVKDGIVTLRGEADNQAQKDLATEYVKDIEGVKDVKNEMAVAKPAKESSKGTKDIRTIGDKIDDASITAMVKTTLLYHRSTSGLQTKVETKNGVVTLSGKAKNAAEKDLATKLAKDVKGVEDVNNRMTIE
ncbi:BON domain-containing protein [Desulfurivibrio sp. C05AmB]|uniref:BON domain-containing protein n=1 Tax=Desulfurivibrio sp. C05AmB TaxID=3374371 RepID=UPI00376F11B5